MELYKKYRPKKFENVTGNEATIKALQAKIDQDALPHFMMFTGPSGCGKTTIARILKKHLKCSDSDFYEINCANNRGVDLVRDIESKMQLKSMTGGARIWLLDEAHRLTPDAQEAFLKPLEDTPGHVYFIMCSTDPQKIKNTIRTRATEFVVESLSEDRAEELIKKVVKKEKLSIPEKAVDSIVLNCNGSARLALVLLEKIKDLDEKQMTEAVEQQAAKEAQAFEILRAIMGWGGSASWERCAKAIKDCPEEPESIRRYLLAYFSNCLLDPKKKKMHKRAFECIVCFEKPLYDTGKPGLVMCCYDCFQ